MSAPVLRAEGVRLAYGPATVLDGVDLDVHGGEVVALVGPNGAGKSSLLSILAGDPHPDAGRVLLDAVDLRAIDVAALARRRGVLLQENRLAFPFTVRDVVRMGRAPWRGTAREDEDDAVVADAMVRADVTALAVRTFPTLSGGEKARTSLARVLAQEPGVLLLDEPTAALDIRHQETVLAEARGRAAAGAAVVVVLHDLTLAAAYADRVVLLDAGRVRADGPPRSVLTADLLSEVYGHPVEVWDHDAQLVVMPVRARVRSMTEEPA
ncbi:heme ABC transporter ATP-binding protein [Cellulomonas sp. Leaf334]|uniref:heme ABC transporter ATP-binding protein n=1 Tax=Cellulomonas sp. Leaf334 TaxID=1736339 RepID=UPI0006FE39CB|nr:heme ABC transporter ATP-binding protein [Cellulomonas sp. Leaf334]KQR07703.1 hemin ABC transporter ATP-binding protein [Cellulomonas sp. Leaf334]